MPAPSALVLCAGHAVQDFIYTVDALPSGDGKTRASEFRTIGGGPAATAACAIARLGGRAMLAARIGDDPIGALIRAELEGYGVDCALLQEMRGCGSSTSAVLVDKGGARMIVNHRDGRWPAGTEALPSAAPESLAAVLVDARWPEGAAWALQIARSIGAPGVLDADATQASPEQMAALCAGATHVAFSRQGLKEVSGTEDPHTGLLRVRDRTSAWLCVTLGGEGALSCGPGGVDHWPARDVLVRDTLGAGDVWHGAFTLALAEGRLEGEAVVFAQAAAAIKVQRPGGRAGAPSRAEVDALLAEGKVL